MRRTILDFIDAHGVKGMKWGERKAEFLGRFDKSNPVLRINKSTPDHEVAKRLEKSGHIEDVTKWRDDFGIARYKLTDLGRAAKKD